MHFGFMNVILLHKYPPICFGHSCGHFQGGDSNNNTNIFIMCRDQSIVKSHAVGMVFKYGVFPTYCKCIRIIAVTSLKRVT